jgi:hypothetical protein
MANVGMFHWGVVKQIFYYLQGAKDYDLKFQSNLDNQNQPKLQIIRWCDLDWCGDVDTRRFAIGYNFF